MEGFLLRTGSGNDFLDNHLSTISNDIRTGAGNDAVYTGSGDDTLYGGDGNDTLVAGAGTDILDGGDGNDILDGGAGTNTITGGTGDDLISLYAGTVDAGSGNDTITLGTASVTGTVDGGSGNDTITINGFLDSPYSGHTNWNVGTEYLNYTSGYMSVSTALTSGAAFALQAYNGYWVTYLNLANIENWSFTAGGSSNDLIMLRGNGTIYDGGGGSDKFFADWSAQSAALVWNNTAGSSR